MAGAYSKATVHNSFSSGISSTMEENEKSLLYFGIEEDTGAKKKWWEKYMLPIYRCGRKGKIQGGRLQYFYVPVPEYYFVRGSRTGWKAEKLRECLIGTIEKACPDDYYLHPKVRKMLGGMEQGDLPPISLLEAMLHERLTGGNGYRNVSICLPQGSRTGIAEVLIHLLSPYLSRINFISVIGGEEALFEELEEYFYEEYGIVANRAKKQEKDSFLLNLWGGERETVKFLDTMLKNGYNTKVN